jgi:thiamine-monophosphate kinase
MNEYQMIQNLFEKFPRSPNQLNGLFECDAAMIEIGGEQWGFNIDDFSPEEDMFTSDDPALLGSNLVVATLSDLYAAGVEPVFFMHAITLPKDDNAFFTAKLVEGIKSALSEADCFLCGGDMGSATNWRYCGVAMGRASARGALTRVIPLQPQALWVSGTLGDANLAAYTDAPTPRFELRKSLAKLIREHASACIDTSGGFCDALWQLHTQSPGMRLQVESNKLPLTRELAALVRTSDIPPEAALIGGAGEYELLFTAPLTLSSIECADIESAGAHRIGTVEPDDEAAVCFQRNDHTLCNMDTSPPCPREAATVREHVQDVLYTAQKLRFLEHTK